MYPDKFQPGDGRWFEVGTITKELDIFEEENISLSLTKYDYKFDRLILKQLV